MMYRLLIADDSLDSAGKTQSLLDWADFGISSITVATTYAQAEAKALELKPHLALVNTRLGGAMGHDLVEHLRSLGLKTAFCMLEDSSGPNLIRESMRSGARDYLTRPLDPQELQGFLERAIADGMDSSTTEPTAQEELDPVLGVPYSDLSSISNRIISVVQSDYSSPQTLTAIAAEMHMSSKYIGRVFLKDTGIKFSKYLMAYRMFEAKKRIITTHEKISAIASDVGYVQMNNFYIHFKEYFGMSPSMMRNTQFLSENPEKTNTPGASANEESV